MNLIKIASRVALPMTRYVEIGDKGEVVEDGPESVDYYEFFEPLKGTNIRAVSIPNDVIQTDEAEALQAKYGSEDSVLLIFLRGFAPDKSPAWLAHDNLGHMAIDRLLYHFPMAAITAIESDYALDAPLSKDRAAMAMGFLYSLNVGFKPLQARRGWGFGKSYADLEQDLGALYIRQNGDIPEVRLEPRKLFDGRVPYLAQDKNSGLKGFMPKAGMPACTKLMEEFVEKSFQSIADLLASKKGSYILSFDN